ncbi:retropepsin-like aspartic protease family protein [Ekhidna sp. To15]|uniref:retropepsin-like aspartic protease family protein n=1 Tax=Ekhidna sp. To15 TaxID=3395267 RepID=UPI003F5254A7
MICQKRVLRHTTLFLLFIVGRAYSQEIPLTILEGGHIVVSLKVNDTIPANFILDTGAGVTVMSSGFFKKISNNAEESGFFTGFRHDGDRLDGELYAINSIDLGGFVQKNIIGAVYPPLDDYGIEGLLSMTFFRNKAFTIDYRNQTLRLLSKAEVDDIASNYESVPISLHQKGDASLDISIPVCVGNKVTVNAEFDTGSGHELFLLNPYFMNQLELDSAQLPSRIYTTPIQKRSLKDYSADQALTICDANLPVVTKTVLFREGLIYEALIGSGLFKDKSITIDIPGRRFFVHE